MKLEGKSGKIISIGCCFPPKITNPGTVSTWADNYLLSAWWGDDKMVISVLMGWEWGTSMIFFIWR